MQGGLPACVGRCSRLRPFIKKIAPFLEALDVPTTSGVRRMEVRTAPALVHHSHVFGCSVQQLKMLGSGL